jgi:peptidoglycan/xylan/chitin deacetylase (PgdA/CDA1 family)
VVVSMRKGLGRWFDASPASETGDIREAADTRTSLHRSSRNGHTLNIGRIAQTLLANLPTKAAHADERVVVLCYHSIHPSNHFASATPELFEQHIRWLRAHCDIIPFAQTLERRDEGNGGRPAVAITFDDGYVDNHAQALPILVSAGAHATFFITTGLIDRDERVIARLKRLWNAPAEEMVGMTWLQVIELRDAGMDIGAHTVTHPNLGDLSEQAVSFELSRAKQLLEDHLRQRIVSLAYPFGVPQRNFSQQTMRLARDVGYERAAAILYRNIRSFDHEMAIPRLAVTGDSIAMLKAKIQGKLDPFGFYQEHAPRWVVSILSHSHDGTEMA